MFNLILPNAMDKSNQTLLVGISGCSCSGKSTLAQLLGDVFPGTLIVHEDDFYKPKKELPTRKGIPDWDCVDALNIPSMTNALCYIRQHGVFPPEATCAQLGRSLTRVPEVRTNTITALQNRVKRNLPTSHPMNTGALRLCIVDGFLLFSPSLAAIHTTLDLKLFLRASYTSAKRRRKARGGNIWIDPPGHFDNVVWPSYVQEHSWLFEAGDVNGNFDADILYRENIKVPNEGRADCAINETLEWAVDIILAKLRRSG